MRSVNPSTFLASLLFAAAFSVGLSMAMVTVFADSPAPTVPGAVVPATPTSHTSADDDLADVLGGIEQRLADLETGQPVASSGPAVHDGDLLQVLERLQRIEDRLAILEHNQHRDPVATDGDSVTPTGAAAAPSNLDEIIDARIKWLEEEKARKAREAREQQIIDNLERTREWYGKVYDKAIEVMNTELGMSVAQIDSMRRLLEWRGDELLKNQDPRVPQEERRNWQQVNNEFNERVTDILSPQQLQIYREKKLGDFNAIQRQLWQQQRGNQNQGGAADRGRINRGAVRQR